MLMMMIIPTTTMLTFIMLAMTSLVRTISKGVLLDQRAAPRLWPSLRQRCLAYAQSSDNDDSDTIGTHDNDNTNDNIKSFNIYNTSDKTVST